VQGKEHIDGLLDTGEGFHVTPPRLLGCSDIRNTIRIYGTHPTTLEERASSSGKSQYARRKPPQAARSEPQASGDQN
jgi:hypothetical protein